MYATQLQVDGSQRRKPINEFSFCDYWKKERKMGAARV